MNSRKPTVTPAVLPAAILVLLAGIAAVVQNSAFSQTAQPGSKAKAVSYDDVKRLLKSKTPEARILRILEKASPTRFVLSAADEQELKKLGASDAVIAAMKRLAKGGRKTNVEISNLAIVLDCSGSMAENTSDGRVKMDVAKEVVTDLVRRIPDGLHVTFIIYGHDLQLGCRGVRVVRGLSSITPSAKSTLIKQIATLKPASKTPIALSLKTAYAELAKRDKECGLILISDGKETCGGDPQAEVKRLVADHDCQFGVNVVGFDVDADGRKQLKELALGGKYYDAKNAVGLKKAVSELVERVDETAIVPGVVEERSPVSSLVVKPFRLEGFPHFDEVRVYKGASEFGTIFGKGNFAANVVQKITKFGKRHVVAAGTYRVWARRKDNKRWVKLTDVTIAAKTKSILDPNRLVGGIVISKAGFGDFGKLEAIRVYPTGRYNPANFLQFLVHASTKYDTPIPLMAGQTYDVHLKFKGSQQVPVKTKLKIKAGRIVKIGT